MPVCMSTGSVCVGVWCEEIRREYVLGWWEGEVGYSTAERWSMKNEEKNYGPGRMGWGI